MLPFLTVRSVQSLFEQIMLMGSTPLIAEIRVWKFLYLNRKEARYFPRPTQTKKDDSGSDF